MKYEEKIIIIGPSFNMANNFELVIKMLIILPISIQKSKHKIRREKN